MVVVLADIPTHMVVEFGRNTILCTYHMVVLERLGVKTVSSRIIFRKDKSNKLSHT